jgi:hypothetical protein
MEVKGGKRSFRTSRDARAKYGKALPWTNLGNTLANTGDMPAANGKGHR